MTNTLEAATSADGITIAFERSGDGPPVLLIGGAFNDRTTVAGLAAVLAPDFTAVAYNRRGRGDSGDSDSYAVEREIEDISAVLDRLGESANVFGHSSGADLALEAAASGVAIDKLAVYEPIYVVEGTRTRPAGDLVDRIRALIDEDRRDEAVTLFFTEQLDMPLEMVEGMRASEMWAWFTGLAHTLPYDLAVCGPGCVLPTDRIRTIKAPTLAIGGGLSPESLPAGARAVADTIPGARYVTLEGQDHGVLNQPAALGPLLLDFLVGPGAQTSPDLATSVTRPRRRSVNQRKERESMAGVGTRQPLKPGPELEPLQVFIGKWINEGQTVASAGAPAVRILTSDVYEWAPGGFFVLHYAYGLIGSLAGGGIEILRYDHASRRYVSHFFDSQGNVSTDDLTVDGDSWTWAGESRRCTAIFTEHGATQTAHHERSDDGVNWVPSMEVTLRKVE